MLRPRDSTGRHTPQRSAAAGQFGKAAQVAAVVGNAGSMTPGFRPAGELRGALGWLNQGERK